MRVPKKYLLSIPAILIVLAFLNLHRKTEDTISSPISNGKILEEAGKMKKSKNPDWWLSSGGIMSLSNNMFATNIGRLPDNYYWRRIYSITNPQDTDNGYHSQNIFRLVTRKKWKDYSQSVYFYIDTINPSKSKNRNGSNGILFFNRYKDENNLYYAGIRVDGNVVIKKKVRGKYYTLAEKTLYSDKKYDRNKNYNLIPTHQWIGIKSEVRNISKDAVSIKLYIYNEQNEEWELVLDAEDDAKKSRLAKEGYAGIRTDFMDAYFKNYNIFEM